jgi:hypothetical protein
MQDQLLAIERGLWTNDAAHGIQQRNDADQLPTVLS